MVIGHVRYVYQIIGLLRFRKSDLEFFLCCNLCIGHAHREDSTHVPLPQMRAVKSSPHIGNN